jgi:hypothetical protein
MEKGKVLIELSDEQFQMELKAVLFLDDLRVFCEKFKLPETFMEERIMTRDDLPKRILRTIFQNQPLSLQFLTKHIEKYDHNWLFSNKNIERELIDDLKIVKRLIGIEESED